MTTARSRLLLFFSLLLVTLETSRVDALLLLLLPRTAPQSASAGTRVEEDPRRAAAAPIVPPALSPPTGVVVSLAAAAAVDGDPSDRSSSSSEKKKKQLKKKRTSPSPPSWPVTLWVHLVSLFVLVNYFFCPAAAPDPAPAAPGCCWPAGMATRVSLSTWSLVHALSGMLFSGGIVTTTVLEWRVVQHSYYHCGGGGGGGGGAENQQPQQETKTKTIDKSNRNELLRFWFRAAPAVERWLVLPALTGSLVSGVAQSAVSYGRLRNAPRHVQSSLHLLLLFGLWWGITDRRTQRRARELVDNGSNSATVQEEAVETSSSGSDSSSSSSSSSNTHRIPLVLRQRRLSNLVSCAFLVALYAVMVLKPGYVGPP